MAAIPPDPAQLAALAKSQSLATLLATMSGNGGLGPGKTIDARLVALDADGTATALVDGVKVALVLAGPEAKQAALQPGASLTLRLAAPAEPGGALQATLIGIRPAPSGGATPPASAEAPPPGTPPGLATQPRATARAGGPSIGTSAQSLAPALAVPMGRVAVAPAAPQPTPAAVAVAPRAVAGPLLGAALGRQDSLAPLFANLSSLAQGSVALTLPKPLMTLVDQILGQRLPVSAGQPLTAQTLKAAVGRSGLFLEARQAAGETPTPQTDLKAALLGLRDLLRPAVDGTPAAPLPHPGET